MDSAFAILLLFGCFAVTCRANNELHHEFKSETSERSLGVKNMPVPYFDDCEDALQKGFSISGVYRIKPPTSLRPFNVWCDMESDGGGWTLIQARFDGLIDFFRTWVEYRNGFGSVDSEHWLGNNFIHHITQDNKYELKIELTGFKDREFAAAKYSFFRIGSEDEKYKLYVSNFTAVGNIIDSLSTHNGGMFSTKDKDNDIWSENCAQVMQGGWWYGACYACNLNGVWMSHDQSIATRGNQTADNQTGVNWRPAFNVDFYSLKSVEMKVRKLRSNCDC